MKEETILIVDDEEKNIKLIKGILKSEQYNVFGALSGEEAITMVPDICPDLILLDIMMPGMDGFEVCRRLKNDEKTKMIPIVMVTALDEKEHSVKAMTVGADDFLTKPVDHTELQVRIKSLLRIKAYHDTLLDSYREITEKNEKLQELERIKEALTHMIIHDLRTPLMVISANLELLQMNGESFSEKQLQKIEVSVRNCAEINQLIQSLLDTHKMEEGKLKPDKETVDPAALADEVVEQFSTQAEAKQMSLSFTKPNDIPSTCLDANLIKRVLTNLITNAIRHTPEGGTIEVNMDLLMPEKESICLRVRDNGNGLAPQYHQKIFDKFEQVSLKQSGVICGASGLGLAFCKLAVEAHGGTIWVESEGEGKGATFNFTLPLLKQESEDRSQEIRKEMP
jgi:signal transduction histidine kinase